MKLNRKNFLKSAGVAALGMVTVPKLTYSKKEKVTPPDACVLIPSETAGPFPLDLTENTIFFRQDLRESKSGVYFKLKMKIIGQNNCEPMQNARVNIWHCDKDGLYSGYSQNNNPGQAGLTYLRGYQFTDANGEVEFITIFPGWYTGRICHIHFQVYVSSSYAAISQMTFDIPTKNALYTANPQLYSKGVDPMSLSNDNIFSDGYQYQLATLNPNTTTGGYDAYLEVSVQGSGTTSIGHIEKENAKQFQLGQNYPNPFELETTIPLKLLKSSRVKIVLFDLNGKAVAKIFDQSLNIGDHNIPVNLDLLGIPKSSYAFQLEVLNSEGTFKDCRLMTHVK